jgi:hypothetical protein
MASAMPLEPATQAALAAEGRPFMASSLASEDLVRQPLEEQNLSHKSPARVFKMVGVKTCGW